MPKFFTAAALTSLVALSTAALAQSVAPGLWEVENKMGGNPEIDKAMAQMRAQLATMPPAQRKQMEAMMAQSGVAIGAGGAVAVKVCITPEMAERQQMPTQTQGDCTSKIDSRSGKVLKFSFACTNPASSGEGTYVFESDKAYTMEMTMKGQDSGKVQNTTLNGKGQWLSADCGSVKPITLPSQ